MDCSECRVGLAPPFLFQRFATKQRWQIARCVLAAGRLREKPLQRGGDGGDEVTRGEAGEVGAGNGNVGGYSHPP